MRAHCQCRCGCIVAEVSLTVRILNVRNIANVAVAAFESKYTEIVAKILRMRSIAYAAEARRKRFTPCSAP